MPNNSPMTPENINQAVATALVTHRKAFLVQGIVLCVLGLLAIGGPLLTTLLIDILVGWLFMMGGIIRILSLIKAKDLPGYWWSMLGAVLAIVLGLVLIAKPTEGALTLTMVMVVLFAIEGVSAILSATLFRQHSSNWGWLLVSGIVNLILVVMILQGWPDTAAWAIGLLAGINLFFMGVSILMLALSAAKPDSPS